jgi:hypothetical protein
MQYVSFEYRLTNGGVFYTRAAEHQTADEAKGAVKSWNSQNTNPKRGYAWSPKSEAPKMKV